MNFHNGQLRQIRTEIAFDTYSVRWEAQAHGFIEMFATRREAVIWLAEVSR